VELSFARHETPALAEQLPYSYVNYAYPLRAWQRLGYIADLSQDLQMAGYVIHNHNSVSGVASVVPARVPAGPSKLPRDWGLNPRTTQGLEIDYWVRETSNMIDYLADQDIVTGLTLAANDYASQTDLEEALVWSLTDETNTFRQSALAAKGFTPIQPPAVYNTGDRCLQTRQLHAVPLSALVGV
jgi:hypothetical protein